MTVPLLRHRVPTGHPRHTSTVPVVFANVPMSQGLRKPPVQKKPAGQGAWADRRVADAFSGKL